MRAWRYALDEALASLWRGRRSGLLSTATVALALFVLGGFLLAAASLDRMSVEWSRAAEISVYLEDAATPADRGDIERLLAPGGIVASFGFVSKEQALLRFKGMFADLAATADSLGANPFPASYDVRLRSSDEARGQVDDLVDKLRASAGVADVGYDRQWLDRLLSAIGILRGVGLALGVILTTAAALTVANVVRLALAQRQDEIEIMQLVGAPQTYIRGPFVMEGVLQGGIGALAALATLAIVFLATSSRYLVPLAAAVNVSSIRFLSVGLCAMILAIGMVVGCLGGLVASSGRT